MLLLRNYTPRSSHHVKKRGRYDALMADSDSDSEISADSSDSEPEKDKEEEEEGSMGQRSKSLQKKSVDKLNDHMKQYYYTKTGKEISECLTKNSSKNDRKKGMLESHAIDVKKIEYRKKLNIVWNSIIEKYSAFDEDDQGDLINLRNFSIEEDKGHIKKLQDFQRTDIWNEFNEMENENVENQDDFDPSLDPINLLHGARNGSRSATPSSQSKTLNSLKSSHNSTQKGTPTTSKPMNKGTLNSMRDAREKTNDLGDDPFLLLTPRASKRPTRATSPRRKLLLPKTTQPSVTQSIPETSHDTEIIDLTKDDDPISMLTPRKSSKIPTRRSSPRRSSIAYTRAEASSPMRSMAPPPTPTSKYAATNSRKTENDDPLSLVSDPRRRKKSTRSSLDHNIQSSPLVSMIKEIPRGRTMERLAEPETSSTSSAVTGFKNPLLHIRKSAEQGTISSNESKSLSSVSIAEQLKKFTGNGSSFFKPPPFTIPEERLNPVRPEPVKPAKAPSTPSRKKRHCSPVYKLLSRTCQLKASLSNDPISLLTPKSATRRNSRRPTRASSPKSTPSKRVAEQEDDPLVLLTPRSSVRTSMKKQKSNLNPTVSRLPPPPKFKLYKRTKPVQKEQNQQEPLQSPYISSQQPIQTPFQMPMNPYLFAGTPQQPPPPSSFQPYPMQPQFGYMPFVPQNFSQFPNAVPELGTPQPGMPYGMMPMDPYMYWMAMHQSYQMSYPLPNQQPQQPLQPLPEQLQHNDRA